MSWISQLWKSAEGLIGEGGTSREPSALWMKKPEASTASPMRRTGSTPRRRSRASSTARRLSGLPTWVAGSGSSPKPASGRLTGSMFGGGGPSATARSGGPPAAPSSGGALAGPSPGGGLASSADGPGGEEQPAAQASRVAVRMSRPGAGGRMGLIVDTSHRAREAISFWRSGRPASMIRRAEASRTACPWLERNSPLNPSLRSVMTPDVPPGGERLLVRLGPLSFHVDHVLPDLQLLAVLDRARADPAIAPGFAPVGLGDEPPLLLGGGAGGRDGVRGRAVPAAANQDVVRSQAMRVHRTGGVPTGKRRPPYRRRR